jgi:integrase
MAGMTQMRLPKYVRVKSGTYHYQRDYPTSLRHLCAKKTFTYPLKLSVNNVTETQLNRKAIEAHEAFERQKLLISNSDPDALSATDLDKAAADFLRKRQLRPSQFVRVHVDSEIQELERIDGVQRQPYGADHADFAVPEFEDILNKHQRGEALTAQERVIGHARMKLVNKEAAKPKTLGSLWKEYKEHRGIDPDSRVGKKAEKYWDRWLSLCGDCTISPNTLAHINEGMDAYVLERQGKVTSQSLQRELSDVSACLRYANKRHRYGWHIELPYIKPTIPETRDPLEPSEQVELVKAILHPSQPIKPIYGAALLLCLQGGMMVSEIRRLEPDDIGLDADIPHLKVVNATKSKDRKRIVPIVLGLQLIRDNLPETIKWLRGCTEATPSATLKKNMRRVVNNPKTSPHCLRHTFKVNAQTVGIDVLTIASIAGWSDDQRGLSRHLLKYGSTAISKSEVVKKLYSDSQRIHEHLIEIEVADRGNVLAFRRK